MAVLALNGSTDYVRFALPANLTSGLTCLTVVKLTSSPNYSRYYSQSNSAGTSLLELLFAPGGGVALNNDKNYCESTVQLTTSVWGFVAVRHGSSSVGNVTANTPRMSVGMAGGAMSHGNAVSGAAQAATQAGGAAYIGCATTTGTPRDFGPVRIALHVVIPSVISADASIDALFGKVLADFTALSPAEEWEFNQASTATTILGLVGGFNEASRSGTTVVTGDDPPSDVYTITSGGGGTTVKQLAALGVG